MVSQIPMFLKIGIHFLLSLKYTSTHYIIYYIYIISFLVFSFLIFFLFFDFFFYFFISFFTTCIFGRKRIFYFEYPFLLLLRLSSAFLILRFLLPLADLLHFLGYLLKSQKLTSGTSS